VTDHIQDLTAVRDKIAGAMIVMLEGAAFDNRPVDEEEAERLIESAEAATHRHPAIQRGGCHAGSVAAHHRGRNPPRGEDT
jgi:hypothetical protein